MSHGILPNACSLHAGSGIWSKNRKIFMSVNNATGSLTVSGAEGLSAITWDCGASLGSPAGSFLTMQTDGNLVLYDVNGNAYWATGTFGEGFFVELTENPFDVVVKDHTDHIHWRANVNCPILPTGCSLHVGSAIWSKNRKISMTVSNANASLAVSGAEGVSATWNCGASRGRPDGSFLIMQCDGNLVLYDVEGTAYWATGTSGEGLYVELTENPFDVVVKDHTDHVHWRANVYCPALRSMKCSVAIRSCWGRPMTVEPSGHIFWNREPNAIGGWEHFTIEDLGNHNVTVRSAHGKYLCSEGNNKWICNRDSPGGWETFQLHPCGEGKFALHSHCGYLMVTDHAETHTAAQVGGWEQLIIEYV